VRRAALLGALALAACSSKALTPDGGPDKFADVWEDPTVITSRDIDIVFMMDNSVGMRPLQAKLTANFPIFVQMLSALPGGLPNLHLAVVSSDLGAGKYDVGDIPTCRHGGDQGIFQNAPRGTTCGTAMLNPGEHFISNINGQANYTGELEDVFACIAALGSAGCGFEHQLGSVLRALGADGNGGAPAENANFLRDNAFLLVVIATDEDDCSAPFNSDLFDPTSRLSTDPLGPLTSYRCNLYGHLCGGKPPPRDSAADLTGTCRSAEDGRLLRISDVALALERLKADPTKVLVSVIAGPGAPYKVSLVAPTLKQDPGQWPAVEHSCAVANEYADPAIRLGELVTAFGGNGLFQTACADPFASTFQRIAEQVGRVLPSPQ
jgi:hypothetical protein